MTSQPDERPFSESNLESPEYRARLQRKLNCLIAVLEVACAKVRRSLTGPDADTERLTRIQKNLQDTLNVCQRAKRALERRESLPADLPDALASTIESSTEDIAEQTRPNRVSRPGGMVFEMSDAEEFEKFQGLGPIESGDIRSVDFDELGRLFQEGA